MLHIFEGKHADFPVSTHVDQKRPESYPELIRKATKFNEDLIWVNNYEESQIANINGTPLPTNIPNTNTFAKIGSFEVNIRTHLQEMIHGTAILWIVDDGTKLSSMLVFKCQPDDRVERRLHQKFFVKDIKVFAYHQPKAWNNNITIMKKLINEIWKKYYCFVLKKDMMC